ncbi:MAG: UPF0104 family protein [Alphaproteobacteria bacterium]|nr:UPF0104 family protein [Alphaproteobacteria bacterium]
MLYWQLRNYSLMDIGRALWHIPFGNLVLACFSCLAGYIVLSFYDYLALDYVGHKISWWKWMLAGMLGFAISNNAGHAVVSGGAIRYRLYTRWRVPGSDIIKMLTFSGFTFFLGYAAVAVIGYFLVPQDIFAQSSSASVGVVGLFIACLSVILAYYAIAIMFCDKSIRIGEIKFHIPSIGAALIQTLLGVLDALCAGLVLYFCISPYIDMPFGVFIGLYVIANVAGVFSQVPGGIGVFESIFMVALPDTVDKASIFGALLAYRIIYYVLPLIGVGGLFFIYERWLRARMKRWLEEAKQKMPHIQMPHKSHKLK